MFLMENMLGARIRTLKEWILLGYVVQFCVLVLGLYILFLTYADHLTTWLEQTVIVIVWWLYFQRSSYMSQTVILGDVLHLTTQKVAIQRHLILSVLWELFNILDGI